MPGHDQVANGAAPAPRVPRIGGRIPSLDGLRALSIGIVLLAHVSHTRYFPEIAELGNWQLGNLGVRIFFVISGFLITTLLLEEVDKTGTISISQFYLRRTLRIFPAFYAFCAAMLALKLLDVLSFEPHDLLAAVTYTMNYHHVRSWNVGHLWSLSVEEQFYLLWPATLVALGVRRGLSLAAAVVVFAPLLRIGLGHWPAFRPGIGETFPTVADALASGCLLAGLRPALSRSERWLAFQRSPLFWITALAVAAAARNSSAKLDWLVGQTLMNLGIAAIIDWSIRAHEGRLGRVLNSAPFVFIGTLSYSLYLWQQIFLNRRGHWIGNSFPLNLALAALTATASYYLVERPFLRLRVRLQAQRRAPRPSPLAAR